MKDLKDLFVHGLRDMYWVEKKLLTELKKMAGKAQNEELSEAFLEHREETQGQIERLDKVFKMVDLAPRGEKCDAMEGILGEGKEMMEKCKSDDLLDAIMIEAGNKVEHYEIASYGSLREFASKLGLDDAVELLQQSLEEESAADEKLSRLAEGVVNEQATEAA